jgi:uncharacterized repeat protein (TIGR03803 family)
MQPLKWKRLSAAVCVMAILAAPSAQAQTYSVLYNFGGSAGAGPFFGSLAKDKSGTLYGTTTAGGSSGNGTVFKLTTSGTESVLHSFTGGPDGGYPYSGVVLSGNTLYGTAAIGGFGYGVVFEMNIKSGAETVLYAFTGGADGAYPETGLVRDKNGNLYGTTFWGGANANGVVFKLVPRSKRETVLHSFDYTHGANPLSGLTLNKTGRILFGTAVNGGSGATGVVFRLTIKKRAYTVLYNFNGQSGGGGYPSGTLALDPEGNLYGATGSTIYGNPGTVFEVVQKTKREIVLYAFTGGADGADPEGGVIRDKKGNLYGTTTDGGAKNYGTVFELVRGTQTVLHSFDESDGAGPQCGLIEDSKGNWYGTTGGGGSGDDGVVWEIRP